MEKRGPMDKEKIVPWAYPDYGHYRKTPHTDAQNEISMRDRIKYIAVPHLESILASHLSPVTLFGREMSRNVGRPIAMADVHVFDTVLLAYCGLNNQNLSNYNCNVPECTLF